MKGVAILTIFSIFALILLYSRGLWSAAERMIGTSDSKNGNAEQKRRAALVYMVYNETIIIIIICLFQSGESVNEMKWWVSEWNEMAHRKDKQPSIALNKKGWQLLSTKMNIKYIHIVYFCLTLSATAPWDLIDEVIRCDSQTRESRLSRVRFSPWEPALTGQIQPVRVGSYGSDSTRESRLSQVKFYP